VVEKETSLACGLVSTAPLNGVYHKQLWCTPLLIGSFHTALGRQIQIRMQRSRSWQHKTGRCLSVFSHLSIPTPAHLLNSIRYVVQFCLSVCIYVCLNIRPSVHPSIRLSWPTQIPCFHLPTYLMPLSFLAGQSLLPARLFISLTSYLSH
jgi:hypothetical protein